MTMILLLSLSQTAVAWDCIKVTGCDWINSASPTYYVDAEDFTSTEKTIIQNSANTWDAGSSEILRGATYDPDRGSDRSSTGTGNFYNEVFMKDSAWFASRGYTYVPGKMIAQPFEGDIVLGSGYTWHEQSPSYTVNGYSLSQVMIHEMGHWLGLAHEGDGGDEDGDVDENAVMNGQYPTGGDYGEVQFRIGEDDYQGLVAAKGDSNSTGSNFLLQRWRSYSPGVESWAVDEGSNDWSHCPGDFLTGSGAGSSTNRPGTILLNLQGTSSWNGVDVEWRLDPGSVCFSGTEYVVANAAYNISVGSPLEIRGGDWEIPANTPPGDYKLCAKVDADGTTSETSESDNIIRSEKNFIVENCP